MIMISVNHHNVLKMSRQRGQTTLAVLVVLWHVNDVTLVVKFLGSIRFRYKIAREAALVLVDEGRDVLVCDTDKLEWLV